MTEDCATIKMVGIADNIITSSPERHELRWDTAYRFEGTDYQITAYEEDSSYKRCKIWLHLPKNVHIVREELSPLRVLTTSPTHLRAKFNNLQVA